MNNPIKIVLLIILISFRPVYGQPGNWQIAGKMPLKISGAESVVVDSTIYFLGGYSDSLQNVVDWIYSFNPLQNSWKFLGHMKKKRINFIADKIGSKIYCNGGETDNAPKGGGSIEEFDCGTNNSAIIDSGMQFNREHSTGFIKDSILYIIGGMTSTPHGEIPPYIIEYNIPARKVIYNYIPSFPGMRTDQMAVYLFNNLYIFGGLYNTVSSDINVFGLKDHSLNLQHPGLLRPRANGRAIKLNDSNQVLILGGYNEINDALNSVEFYKFTDSVHFTSRSIESMIYKRNDFMSVCYKDSIYVFGGRDEFGNLIDRIERLKLTSVSGIKENQIPASFKVEQNYPNPFNLSTIIRYYVPVTSLITIKIYDVLGRELENLINEEKPPGIYNISFNGNGLASGVYYYRINEVSGNGSIERGFSETKKMILLK